MPDNEKKGRSRRLVWQRSGLVESYTDQPVLPMAKGEKAVSRAEGGEYTLVGCPTKGGIDHATTDAKVVDNIISQSGAARNIGVADWCKTKDVVRHPYRLLTVSRRQRRVAGHMGPGRLAPHGTRTSRAIYTR